MLYLSTDGPNGCEELARDIQFCQSNGISVMISRGGGNGSYYSTSCHHHWQLYFHFGSVLVSSYVRTKTNYTYSALQNQFFLRTHSSLCPLERGPNPKKSRSNVGPIGIVVHQVIFVCFLFQKMADGIIMA
jgi:hypothetical protein